MPSPTLAALPNHLTAAGLRAFAPTGAVVAIAALQVVTTLGVGETLPLTAASTVSAFFVVRGSGSGAIACASSSLPADADQAIGIAVTAANAGQTVTVQTSGSVTNPAWAWAPGPVFLGVAGALTQSPSSTGFLQQIGVAVATTQIILGLRAAIILS